MSEEINHEHLLYSLERYPYGWLIRSGERGGIPLDLFSEFLRVCPKGVIDPGISGATKAVCAFGLKEDCELWRKAIDDSIDQKPWRPAEK